MWGEKTRLDHGMKTIESRRQNIQWETLYQCFSLFSTWRICQQIIQAQGKPWISYRCYGRLLPKLPFGAKVPKSCPKNQCTNCAEEKANSIVIWVPPVWHLLFPQCCLDLSQETLRKLRRKFQVIYPGTGTLNSLITASVLLQLWKQ